MQQTPSPIEQIKILYTNTNLPAALYGADGSVIWQNAAALHLAQLFPCEEWSAAAVRETAARIAGNSGQPLSYQTVSLAYYTLTVLPLAPEGPFLITYLPGAREPETPDLMPALLAGNAICGRSSGVSSRRCWDCAMWRNSMRISRAIR